MKMYNADASGQPPLAQSPVEGQVVHPVDELPAPRRLFPLAIQHVLVMYAGAVTVPLVIGRALDLPPDVLGMLISADLFACGLATLLQTLGLPRIGIRLPIMMGVTFASVGPMLALISAGLDTGRPPFEMLTAIYGGVIVAGLFGFLAAPVISRLTHLFPPLVSGTVILIIGLTLMRIAINWAAGGGAPDGPGYGSFANLGLALVTLLVVLTIMRLGRGLVRNAAILFGAMGGTILALVIGKADFAGVANAPWFGIIRPFQFGLPHFEGPIAVAMCLVMIVVMIESSGMFLAAGEMVGRPVGTQAMANGLRADAFGTLIGGLFNTFPYTSYAQNIGLIAATGIRSRHVCAAGGVLLVLMGLCPKLAAIAAAVPVSVLGGAGFVMFGMVAATGIRILGSVELTPGRLNVIAVSIGVGLIPIMSESFFKGLPSALAPLFHSGIVLTTISAVLLNQIFGEAAKPGEDKVG